MDNAKVRIGRSVCTGPDWRNDVQVVLVWYASSCIRMSFVIIAISKCVPDKVSRAHLSTHILWTKNAELPNVLSYYHCPTYGTLGLGISVHL